MNEFEMLVESFLKGSVKDPKDLSVFIEKRAQGAQKIQQAAEKKGGYAKLTAIHFKAKRIPYAQCKKHGDDENSVFFKQKADECYRALKAWDKMSQKEFQHVMGQLEAYGEVYIRSTEAKGR